MDVAPIVSDLLRTATLALFVGAAYYVKELASEVRAIRKSVQNHGERIAKIEGVHEAEANGIG